MARNLQSVISRNRSSRKGQMGFIEALDPLIKSAEVNNLLLNNISKNIEKIDDNTKALGLVGNTLKTLANVMGNFVDIFSKDIQQKSTSAFFSGALAKEKEYESKFGKTVAGTSPTKEKISTKDESGFFGTLLKWLGGALLVGGVGTWLWKNEDFKKKVTGFFGTLFEGISEGAQTFYNLAKEWINDEKNQETIGNFFSGLLNAIAKGFELMGDLWRAVVKEYEKEDSPLRKTVNGILESIWGFVGEHPLITLGGALVLFGDKIGALAVGIYGAVKTIELAIAGIAAVARHPALLAAAGLIWGLDKLTEWSEKQKAENAAKIPEYKKDIENIQNPELKKEIENEIQAIKKSPVGLGVNMTEEDKELQAYHIVYGNYRQKIEEDKQKQFAEQAYNIALGSRTQPVVAGPNVTVGTIQPSVSTASTISPERQKEIDQMEDESALWNHEPQQSISTTIPVTATKQRFSVSIPAVSDMKSANVPITTPTPSSVAATPTEKPKTEPQKVSQSSNSENKPILIKESDKGIKSKTGIKINEEYAMSFFMGRGWTREQSAGIVSNLIAESNLDTGALNPDSKAAGIAQWLSKSRVNLLKQRYEVSDVRNATPDQQLDFVDWELKNTHKNAGQMLKQSKDPVESANVIMKYYEIPSAKEQRESFPKRKNNALRLSKGDYSNIQTEALQTQGKDYQFKIPLSSDSQKASTLEPFSPEWLQNIINNVTQSGLNIEQIRAMPPGLINAPPKAIGYEINRASKEIQDAQNKPPEVIVNAPTVNNTSSGKNTNKDINMASIFDEQFIERLVGRSVDLFTFST